MSKQKSLVNCGFTVKSKTNEDISSLYFSVKVNYKKYKSCALIDDINERTAFARYLFRSNKKVMSIILEAKLGSVLLWKKD